jgi:hypothetical protein
MPVSVFIVAAEELGVVDGVNRAVGSDHGGGIGFARGGGQVESGAQGVVYE